MGERSPSRDDASGIRYLSDRWDRPLTEGEAALAVSMFGSAINYREVTIRRRKWFPFQPRNAVMAPCGHIHVHPASDLWSDDYSGAPLGLQGLFVHEMTHVWQSQTRGRYYLPLMRHPFCRYRYRFEPGRAFDRYGIEQQAEIVRHAFLLRHGMSLAGAPEAAALDAILPFERRRYDA